MKKILSIIVLLFSLSLVACKNGKEEKEIIMKNFSYTNQDIVVKSFFDDGQLVLKLNVYDTEDANDYCNGFYYSGDYYDFLEEIKGNEYCYEVLDGNARFCCDGQFYVLQLIEQYGDCFLCKLLSEYVLYNDYSAEPYYTISVPFPRLTLDNFSVAYNDSSKIDAKYFDYLLNYYKNLKIFNIEISDNVIKIIDFKPASKNVDLCDISIIKDDAISIKVDIKQVEGESNDQG